MDRLSDHEARELIRSALDDTLVVEAAAGTGKTTALVERIVEVLASGRADVEQIVAVTFTEKAAGELKLRLREALEHRRQAEISTAGLGGAAVPGDLVRQRLDAALARLEEAHVNTIHGFSADLLRERPVEAGVDPLFEVLSEAQADRLLNEAFDAWLGDQLEDPPPALRRSLRRPGFLGAGGGAAGPWPNDQAWLPQDQNDSPTERLRRAVRDLAEWRDFRAKPPGPLMTDSPRASDPFDRDRRVDALLAALDLFEELAARPASARDPLYIDARPALTLGAEIRRARALGAVDYDAWEAALCGLARNREFRRARKGSGKMYGPGVPRAAVIEARGRLAAALEDFRRDADASLASGLHEELGGCLERYAALKARRGALDFLDLLLRARDLVRDCASVRQAFQARFTHIFVDEFQDTDPLQAELLLLLAADDPSTTDWRRVTPVPGKLFIVGDPKQSIYRFRRADVGIYREVCEQLVARGARRIELRTSFRATPAIQAFVNAAFEGRMTGDQAGLQAAYVPLEPFRPAVISQPSVVALPVPEPYGQLGVTMAAIERSLPDAVGAYVDWLVRQSGWTVTETTGPGSGLERTDRSRSDPRPIAPRHICILFRRFVSWGRDMTRAYVDALEARGIPHLLVGGKTFHGREEVEALRLALAAVEWPDDELSVFGTLKGPLFAIGDEELLEYRHRAGVLHPYRVPAADALPAHLQRCRHALGLLRLLHARRNHVPVADTVQRLLDATRAHVAFVMRHAGEQALANVLYIAELARQYEAAGGISFRGFVEELREAAEREEAPEAPILEEASDGVRLMTVHKAKGLEFPVVILADMTARLAPSAASRYLDAARGVVVMRIGGWSPHALLDHEAEELAQEDAEGIRLAYVAATRARDLLVVPAVGDQPFERGWVSPLNEALYPPAGARRDPRPSPGCPAFRKDSVLARPDGDPAGDATVAPGLHRFAVGRREVAVTWWDPHALDLRPRHSPGLRREELIVKDVPEEIVQEGLRRYGDWRSWRDGAVARGSRPSVVRRTATEHAQAQVALAQVGLAADLSARLDDSGHPASAAVALVRLARDPSSPRPAGRRFGTLVHAVLAVAPLDATADQIARIAALEGRVLAAPEGEVAAAAAVVAQALASDLVGRARRADRAGRCRREVPLAFREADGTLVEGVVDLAFEEDGAWTVVDFKTDQELGAHEALYRFQVALYARAVEAATGKPARAVLASL